MNDIIRIFRASFAPATVVSATALLILWVNDSLMLAALAPNEIMFVGALSQMVMAQLAGAAALMKQRHGEVVEGNASIPGVQA